MTIAEIIKRLANTDLQPLIGKVKEVNGITCTVELLSDETELYKVGLATQENGVLLTPKIDSFVLVALLNQTTAYVVSYGELESIKLGDGTFGGLIKIEDLVSEINGIKSDINDIKTAFSSWVVAPSDGGAALKTIAATWYGTQLTDTNKSDIENDKITHGDL